MIRNVPFGNRRKEIQFILTLKRLLLNLRRLTVRNSTRYESGYCFYVG